MENKERVISSGIFDALALFTKLYHKPMSVGELTSGLPFDVEKNGPEIFSCDNMLDNFARAAERGGLRTRLAARTLDDIGALTLPLILIMKEGGGVILDSISEDRKKFRIVSPEAGDSLIWVDRDKIEAGYSNHLFYLGKGFGSGDEHGKAPIAGVRGHWFWETIKYSWPLYSDVLKASVVVNIFVLASPLFTMNVY
ncbi:MAG TPA: type I secretion system permease/ATPase, partial [Candidatus Wallbacteria bacterium]|nr:type I secretion system permease/ATPase [Candidatus Wallbacteria bacterium]